MRKKQYIISYINYDRILQRVQTLLLTKKFFFKRNAIKEFTKLYKNAKIISIKEVDYGKR